jgi:hypothetical protein
MEWEGDHWLLFCRLRYDFPDSTVCDMYGCVDESVEGKSIWSASTCSLHVPDTGVDGPGLGRSADVDDVVVDVVVINLPYLDLP